MEKQNQVLFERLRKAEERLTAAESDIYSLRMNYANLEARFNANEGDIREVEDDISALDSKFVDTEDILTSFDMNVSANMMSIKQNYKS